MITERIALIMLDGMVQHTADDPHHTKQYYKSIRQFADVSLAVYQKGQYSRLERYLKLAWRLFSEGNETVKNGIMNVYLNVLSFAMDKDIDMHKCIEPFMPHALRIEYHRQLNASGV